MADVTLTYKGSTIAQMDASGSKTLRTAGKYCEGDIGISYVKPSGGGGSTDNEDAIISRTITSYVNPRVTTIGKYAFNFCQNLVSIDLQNVIEADEYAFNACPKLYSVNMPKLTKLPTRCFASCYQLETVKFPLVNYIGMAAFRYSSGLKILILSKPEICTLYRTDAFYDTPIASGTGYIYVPQALLQDYKAATNWVTYAAQFRAIEDYPDICGEV